MPETRFRLYFGERAATAEELGRIDEITVEQAMDRAWQATVRLHLCLDERGEWLHQSDDFLHRFTRLRIELQLAGAPFAPLIDGPIVGYDSSLDSQPAHSRITLTVHDDTAWLNRRAGIEIHEDRPEQDIARDLFAQVSAIGETRIETPQSPSTGTRPATAHRGTPMQFLRQLAQRVHFHAYVLPGATRGRSIGCFLPDPDLDETPALPPLVLLGDHRNLASLEVTEDAQQAGEVTGHSLSFSDKRVTSATSTFRNTELIGTTSRDAGSDADASRLPHPSEITDEDPARGVNASAERDRYQLRGRGRVVPGCYPGLLQPYQTVQVQAGRTPLSGTYLIQSVTHRITPSIYTQQFEVRRRQNLEPGASPSGILSNIF